MASVLYLTVPLPTRVNARETTMIPIIAKEVKERLRCLGSGGCVLPI